MSPDAYALHEARLLQEFVRTSAVVATTVFSDVVPAGKVWTILSASYYPDASEAKYIYFFVQGRSSAQYPITIPQTITLSPTRPFPAVTEGMEIKLFPGEYLGVTRDSATAGSSMVIRIRYIENDLPYYAYEEPLKKIVNTAKQHGSQWRAGGGISTGGPGGSPGSIPHGGGGGGVPPPV